MYRYQLSDSFLQSVRCCCPKQSKQQSLFCSVLESEAERKRREEEEDREFEERMRRKEEERKRKEQEAWEREQQALQQLKGVCNFRRTLTFL